LTSQVLTTPGTKKEGKRVAIIGAGPAGLVTAKECLEAGCKVTTYDSADDIGGEFANRFWPGGKLTSSPYVTSFSDFEPRMNKDGSRNLLHDTKEEYSEYMKIYAKHFKVDKTLKMQEAVTKIAMKKLPDEEPTFNITVKSWKNGNEVSRTDGPYDHIAFCIGGNGTPHVPKVPGLEEFKKLGGELSTLLIWVLKRNLLTTHLNGVEANVLLVSVWENPWRTFTVLWRMNLRTLPRIFMLLSDLDLGLFPESTL